MAYEDLTNIQWKVLQEIPFDYFESPSTISANALGKPEEWMPSSYAMPALKKLVAIGLVEKGICERTKRAGYKRIK